jgi:hypothetical protein
MIPSLHRRLTLLHDLLVVLCTLTISQNQTMTTILVAMISTVHSTSSRPTDIRLVRLAPASVTLSLWTQLSQDAKDIWDKLTDEAKGTILDRQRDSTRPSGCGPPRPPFRNTNLHDISAILLANIHDLCTGTKGDVDDSPETRSVSFASANDTPPTSEDTAPTRL